MQRSRIGNLATIMCFGLAACSGSNGISPVPTAPSGPAAANAASPTFGTLARHRDVVSGPVIGALNSIGASLTSLSEESATERPAGQSAGGVCHHGVEFFAPDRAGDPNSTETEFFYTPNCAGVARDAVRTYASTSANAESVTLAVSNYGPRSATPISTSATTAQFSNATFGAHGFPVIGDGFVREASSQTTVDSKRTLENDSEFVLAPANGNVAAFCTDWAGYNATGIPQLDETFGWSGGMLSGGTRTTNRDGSVTWSGSRNAASFEGPIGSLSIAQGVQNSTCPIGTPAYSIAGGTQKGSSVATISATFFHGWLANLAISRFSLSGGYSLSAFTNHGVWWTNPKYIVGTVSSSGKVVARFGMNAFGDGQLITANGTRYSIVGWLVLR